MTPSINSFLNPSTVFNPSLSRVAQIASLFRRCQIVKQDALLEPEEPYFLASQGGFMGASLA